MQPTPSHKLLQRFIELANAKGATFSHFTVTANRRIRIFYRSPSSNELIAKNFLSYIEALEHIHIAYNLKHQYTFERLEQKSINVQKSMKERKEEMLDELIEERLEEHKERLYRPKPGIKFV